MNLPINSGRLEHRFSMVSNQNFPTKNIHSIFISSKNSTLNVNLSNTQVPFQVQLLLQLGGGFNVPLTQYVERKTTVNFVKHIKKNLFKSLDEISEPIRNQSTTIIKRLILSNPKLDNNKKLLFSWYHSTENFIKEHPEILFTKANKGNITVALKIDDYLSKMADIFSDANTYKIINNNPIKKLSYNLRTLFFRWKKEDFKVDINLFGSRTLW